LARFPGLGTALRTPHPAQADLPFRDFAEDRIVPDEEFHRIKITEWWLRKFDAAEPAQRQEWTAQILAADEALQRILNPYLNESWRLTERSSRIDTRNHGALYDAFRREILAYHLDIPLASLPALTQLEAVGSARAA
jgi:hypothetical protein